MFLDNIKNAYTKNKEKNPVVIRNILKEIIQYYVLDFIYSSSWGESFLFKGGTCLRFCFDLPRLSEDLDFDIENFQKFSLKNFLLDLNNYFVRNLQFSNCNTKVAGNQRTIYLKFPILKDIGIIIGQAETNVLFVRIDLAGVVGKAYKTEVSIKSTYNFSFLMRRYSLPDLFAGKLAAILIHEAYDAKVKKERFKGRDFYDLIWFLEKRLKPNWVYLKELTGLDKEEVLKRLETKIQKLDKRFLASDLIPFIEDNEFINNFIKNYKELFENYKKILAE